MPTNWGRKKRQFGRIKAKEWPLYDLKDKHVMIFDESCIYSDLLTAEHEGFSHNAPAEVYFGGVKVS